MRVQCVHMGYPSLRRLRRSAVGPVDLCGNRCTWFPYSSANRRSDFLVVVCALYGGVSSQKHLLIEFFQLLESMRFFIELSLELSLFVLCWRLCFWGSLLKNGLPSLIPLPGMSSP